MIPQLRAILLLLFLAAHYCGAVPGSSNAAAAADAPQSDVHAAFRNPSGNVETLRFTLDGHTFPSGGHVQGIQLQPNSQHGQQHLILSHDSNTAAYLVMAAIAADDPANSAGNNRVVHVQMLPSDGQQPPLRHAGGIQRVGDLLAVGVEDNQDKLRSEVQFWNIADPTKPTQQSHLTIHRRSERPKEMTAGAVGIVERDNDFLVVVANWDSRNIDFYQSTRKQLDDPNCRFQHTARWNAPLTASRPGKSAGSYQAIQLLTDENDKSSGNGPKPPPQLYLLGFETTVANKDIVDLYAVDLAYSKVDLRWLDQREVKFSGDQHFRFGGGATVDGSRWELVATPSHLTPQTTISLTK
jgi:hypothetical protein